MNSNKFKNVVENCHLKWLSSVLSLKINTKDGIDLSNETIGVELKSKYSIYSKRFAIHSYQVDKFREQNPDKVLFWCLLCYGLSKKPIEIKKEALEDLLTIREAWFLEWDWVRQFPISTKPKTGPYIYVGIRDFSDKLNFHNVYRNKSSLHIPMNSILENMIK